MYIHYNHCHRATTHLQLNIIIYYYYKIHGIQTKWLAFFKFRRKRQKTTTTDKTCPALIQHFHYGSAGQTGTTVASNVNKSLDRTCNRITQKFLKSGVYKYLA